MLAFPLQLIANTSHRGPSPQAPQQPASSAPQGAASASPGPVLPTPLPPSAAPAAPALPTPDGPQPPRTPGARHHLAGGWISGVGEALLFSPLDQAVLRARLRTDPHASVTQECLALWKGGPRQMYRALPADLYGTAVRRASLPTMLHVVKGLGSDLLDLPPDSFLVSALAGVAAGALDPVLTNPPSRLRVLIQSPNNDDKGLNVRAAFRLMREQEGVKGLFKGLPTNMFRGAYYCAIIAGLQQPGLVANMAAAGVAVVCVSPFDVVLARKQETVGGVKKSAVRVMAAIVQKEGVASLFTGTVFKLVMVAPRQGLSLYLAGHITNKLFNEPESDDEP